MAETSELDLVVKYANQKGGGSDGQLVIDDVELSVSRDNRIRHGIGNSDPQYIEKGNKTYTFSTTTMMTSAAANALANIDSGDAETQTVYLKDNDVITGQSEGMVFNDLTFSSSDDGDTTVSVDADLLNVEWTNEGSNEG